MPLDIHDTTRYIVIIDNGNTPTQKAATMFTMDNADGFTKADLALMNEALAILIADGIEESNASDIINNNWMPEGNTVESLIRR